MSERFSDFTGSAVLVTNGVSYLKMSTAGLISLRISLPYLKVLQALRHDVIADLMPFDNIASVLGVSTHCT